ncbi:hypothetical protein E2C01_069275 [Portunus trituberculatus]|uniref:Uncharacterized protein n=1 Tax=Portunus trituberculatus TaxID=210409 RepID=A0A5B7HYG5_PORTR|nr:hypothetical protein [Portunus trituberculatus]
MSRRSHTKSRLESGSEGRSLMYLRLATLAPPRDGIGRPREAGTSDGGCERVYHVDGGCWRRICRDSREFGGIKEHFPFCIF